MFHASMFWFSATYIYIRILSFFFLRHKHTPESVYNWLSLPLLPNPNNAIAFVIHFTLCLGHFYHSSLYINAKNIKRIECQLIDYRYCGLWTVAILIYALCSYCTHQLSPFFTWYFMLLLGNKYIFLDLSWRRYLRRRFNWFLGRRRWKKQPPLQYRLTETNWKSELCGLYRQMG